MQLEREVIMMPSEIGAFTEQTSDFLTEHGVDARAVHHVALVLDEMLTNLATHAGLSGQAVSVRLSIDAGDVRGEIVDRGVPFDPRNSADPDVTAGLADRPVGGLGLFLVRKLTSSLGYAQSGGRNVTTFSVPRAGVQSQERP
jgi:anti-sigma regulatory factor (Ser/Thr protein kinase)